MFSRRFARSAGLAVLLANVLALPSRAADAPTLLKRTLAIKLHRYLRYWPNPVAKDPQYNQAADGKIVDNGVATANKIGGIRMIVPVQIQGTADGKWDAQAWKTGAFYGNPLQGFTAP